MCNHYDRSTEMAENRIEHCITLSWFMLAIQDYATPCKFTFLLMTFQHQHPSLQQGHHTKEVYCCHMQEQMCMYKYSFFLHSYSYTCTVFLWNKSPETIKEMQSLDTLNLGHIKSLITPYIPCVQSPPLVKFHSHGLQLLLL